MLCLAAALPGCDAERRAQLAARVNGAEITFRGEADAKSLDKVIERELLVQQAIHAGLDRDPAIRNAIDQARRQILAEAWLDKLAAGKTVSRDEIHAFYTDNPALFAERRVYQVRETKVLPAEQLPLAHLPQLARMSAGESASFESFEIQLMHAESAPISEAQAAPVIERYLAARKRFELAAAEVRRLREIATIEYAGEFKRSN